MKCVVINYISRLRLIYIFPIRIQNILINRSNVTLDGVEHYVKGEVGLSSFAESGLAGAHYWGFFNASFANNVILKNCILTGRRSYRFSSYEFHADHVNFIRLIGCRQSNFTLIDEDGNEVFSMSHSPLTKWPRCWGIGGTNFCKNMEYEKCRLSRFDAHQGLYNGKIVCTSDDRVACLENLFEKVDGASIITVLYGEGANEEEANRVAEIMQEKFPGVEIMVLDGGQPVYSYIISIE